MRVARVLAMGGWLFAAGAAFAQTQDHSAHGAPSPAASESKKSTTPSTKAYEAAMEKMHHGMMVEYTGDADYDFVKGMIPHHQGAVDMAEIVLKYGDDPEVKRLARSIIIAQKKEILYMRKWLDAQRKGVKSKPAAQ